MKSRHQYQYYRLCFSRLVGSKAVLVHLEHALTLHCIPRCSDFTPLHCGTVVLRYRYSARLFRHTTGTILHFFHERLTTTQRQQISVARPSTANSSVPVGRLCMQRVSSCSTVQLLDAY